MSENNKKPEAILNNQTHDPALIPEDLGDDFFEGDGVIGDALDGAIEQKADVIATKKKAVKKKAQAKRKKVNKVKKGLGIRPSKQSKFPTRSNSFLKDPTSDRAIHAVLNHKKTEIYKDGADICPRILMGIPAYGKTCKKNAFEHLITIQEKIKSYRGDNPANAPRWIILSNDTSMIMDRNLLGRLEELKETTHAAAGYGFERIRASGKWYQIDAETEQSQLRGCYIQADVNDTSWDFIVGSKFKTSPRFRILIAHGPFIAVRGETFMQMNFTNMAEHVKGGFFHYMAEISMQCMKRGLMVAQVKTVSAQFENINDFKADPDFQIDQSYFASKWQSILPASIYDK